MPSWFCRGVGAVVLGVVFVVAGWRGVAYGGLLGLVALAGTLLARRVFGRHPASIITGASTGYGLWALALWGLEAMHALSWLTLGAALLLFLAVAVRVSRPSDTPLLPLPRWTPGTTIALVLLLAVATVIVGLPFARIGERDAEGVRHYRAYFTADFVWHRALVGELARLEPFPTNPYFAERPLHYYWTYFVPPAAIVGLAHRSPGPDAPITQYLLVTAMYSAYTLIATIFLLAWIIVPRAGPAALGTAIAWLASSAEGLWALVRFWREGTPLSAVTDLNIDALTYWWLDGLTADSLSRTLWYNPHHGMASALGLAALVIAVRTLGRGPDTRVLAFGGLCLALAIVMSPFPAAVYGLIYGGTLCWRLATGRCRVAALLRQWIVLAIAGAGLAWHLWMGMSGGARGEIVLGLAEHAGHHPFETLALALGPLLMWAGAGVVAAARCRLLPRLGVGLVGTVVCGALFFFLSLDLEAVWVGWRSAQVWLTLTPPAVALAIVAAGRLRPRWLVATMAGVVVAAAVPTSAIDLFNSQDVSNDRPGPGFKWTVAITPDEQAAFDWIQRQTPADAVVQMALGPRGRETWSAIPSFARRRMAAGLPVSLFRTDADLKAADTVDALFAAEDPQEAFRIARDARIDVIYAGHVEQLAYPGLVARLHSRPDLFQLIYENPEVSLLRVLRPTSVWDRD